MTLYLDANATEPLRPEAKQAVLEALGQCGNPSAIHAQGRAARALLESCRERIARRLGAAPAGLVFVSGGTEANWLALTGLGAGRRLLVGATEHPAILTAAPGATLLPVDRDGRLIPDALADALRTPAPGPPALVCLMLANNETGVLHPLAEAAALCRTHGALLHVDAVQAAGRMPVDFASLGANSLAVSGHKLGGPQGAGALLLDPLAQSLLRPALPGGGQEFGRRGGTPALPAIAGFAAALDAARDATAPDPAIPLLRAAIEQAAQAHGATLVAAGVPRLPNTACLLLTGIDGARQVMALDLEGVAVSSGAACSSGRVAPSHVLAAMGFGPASAHAIRVSLPWNAPPDAATRFACAYARVVHRLRRPR